MPLCVQIGAYGTNFRVRFKECSVLFEDEGTNMNTTSERFVKCPGNDGGAIERQKDKRVQCPHLHGCFSCAMTMLVQSRSHISASLPPAALLAWSAGERSPPMGRVLRCYT